MSLVGGEAGMLDGADAATELPVDRPAPEIAWSGALFVFTGKFAFGPRIDCERQAARRGGLCERSVTQKTRYLIIGTFGSRDWVHTPFGRKIEKALKYRAAGHPVAIVAEEHWTRCLDASRSVRTQEGREGD
jgi:NAD-dependent DNA ligase